MKNIEKVGVSSTIAFLAILMPSFAQAESIGDPRLPSSGLDTATYEPYNIDDYFILALLDAAGASNEILIDLFDFKDRNPIRQSRLQEELLETVGGISSVLGDSIKISFPPFPVRIYEDDYYPAINNFTIAIPNVFSFTGGSGTSSYNSGATFSIYYPNGLQAISDGEIPGYGNMNLGLDRIEGFSEFRDISYSSYTKVWVPMGSEALAERFYDAGTLTGPTNSRNDGSRIFLEQTCEVTFSVIFSSGSEGNRSYYQPNFLCPVTELRFWFSDDASTIYEVSWNGTNYDTNYGQILNPEPRDLDIGTMLNADLVGGWGFFAELCSSNPEADMNFGLGFRTNELHNNLRHEDSGYEFFYDLETNSWRGCTSRSDLNRRFFRVLNQVNH